MVSHAPASPATGRLRRFRRPDQSLRVSSILRPYWQTLFLLGLLTVGGNMLSLYLPRVTSHAIDSHAKGTMETSAIVARFGLISIGVFLLAYGQSIIQVFLSERVARDIRNSLADRISRQSNTFVQERDPAKLLTNLTSDMDSVKLYVSQAVVSMISSTVLIAGASILLLLIDWQLALAVLTIVPIIGCTFFFTLRKVRILFLRGREVIDRLNRVISESILGAAIVRVVNSQRYERENFEKANADARKVGFRIIEILSGLIPVISFVANLATLTILLLGGHFVINGSLTLGEFAAFSSYTTMLIFPILVFGFISGIIAQANASYARIAPILNAAPEQEHGTRDNLIHGEIEARHLTLTYGGKSVLKDVSFSAAAGSRTAIVGPTAAGKSQLLYILTGLIQPTDGDVLIDGIPVAEYDQRALHRQMGMVFQESIVFNLTLRENIAFSRESSDEVLQRAIKTAELGDLVASLPNGLDTVVSERGTNLSGGQKQRLMLARALALNPRILLLDDFTARVDSVTEAKILANVRREFPDITLISVTQVIESVRDYDQIILLMEGELLASGRHEELLRDSAEYLQIYESQRSTTHYEL